MNEKNVYKIAYGVLWDRYRDATAEFNLSNPATVSEMEAAGKALSDFETLAIKKKFDDILIGR